MSIEENKALIHRYIDQLSNHGVEACVAAVDDLLAPGYIHHTEPEGEITRDQMRAGGLQYHQAMPDIRTTISDLIGESDRVAVRFTSEGTHSGDGLGRPPTGNRVRYTAIAIYRVAEGKIQESWENWDSESFARQTGLRSEPSAP